MDAGLTAAIVVYRGVLVDETEVFRYVLAYLPGFRTVTVGTARGAYPGPGGVEVAEATLAETAEPDVIVVPGGIGCHQQVEVAAWLRAASPAWIVASSTGSALLAAAGLLRDATAATHWLAGPLLELHGAHPSSEQVVVDGRIITCSGASSAFRAAFVIAEAYGGQELVDRIRSEAAAGAAPSTGRPAFWRRLVASVRRSPPDRDRDPFPGPSTEGDVLDLGVITLRDPEHRNDGG